MYNNLQNSDDIEANSLSLVSPDDINEDFFS
jgi:hypothetical protein